jgi:tRNA U34 5-carboxymethylaminomethyl modifying GTPase MnmE/TrmE
VKTSNSRVKKNDNILFLLKKNSTVESEVCNLITKMSQKKKIIMTTEKRQMEIIANNYDL